MKRLFDFSSSLFLLVALSPLLLSIALLLSINMGSPILFKQQRPGLNKRLILLYKFRTMNDAVDQTGELLADHDRLTKLGRFLRKYSLDELPQLYNVLKGDLSLVGPRPLLIDYLPLYTKEQNVRHEVKPGITGWAQINGRNMITWEEKFELDLYYVKNQSFHLDCEILLKTFLKVIRKEGVNHQYANSMQKFSGTKEVH